MTVTNIKRRSWLAAGLVLLQVLVLVGMAVSFYAVSWFGQELRVKTVPVDPKDLLYGDYVALSYDISRLDPSLWKEAGSKPQRGDSIYVVVKPGADGLAEAVGAYRSKPSLQAGELALRGQVDYSWDDGIRVVYGVEKYYLPEGTGKSLEQKASKLIVHMKVAPWGQLKIEALEDQT
ncbi:GDYXXLXY domain-containing protein [Paenibacillus cremeus]|uniref:GDYXXLXY domain-containing protein n=1 Tax=Paenibacillus cremeus TaxID=2163881 RepID=A0A559KIL8_9BACL|nr:GDYXXLXY domain-containing protein [Paenibacillus cremeus]TVY11972.1 GDYXXLXY domain-containing protein [Paenibacillus cremeus]